jgi:DNA-binding CsgD family transcriptional regulator
MTTPIPLDLTAAEATIVALLVADFSEPEIGQRTGRGARTINQHVRRALERNHLRTRLALIRAYGDRGHIVRNPGNGADALGRDKPEPQSPGLPRKLREPAEPSLPSSENTGGSHV